MATATCAIDEREERAVVLEILSASLFRTHGDVHRFVEGDAFRALVDAAGIAADSNSCGDVVPPKLAEYLRQYAYTLIEEIAALARLAAAWQEPQNGTALSFMDRAVLLPALLALATDQRAELRNALSELFVANLEAIEGEEKEREAAAETCEPEGAA